MENKFMPSAEQVETAKKIARKNNKSTVWVNLKGEYFLEELFCRSSVSGKTDGYARLDFNESGDVVAGNKYKLTEADLEENPLLKAAGFKVGDEMDMPPAAGKPEKKPATKPIEVPATGDTPPAKEEEPGQAPPPPQETSIPFDPKDKSIGALKKELEGISDVAVLAAIRAFELADEGLKRSGAVKAIEERIAQLTPGK